MKIRRFFMSNERNLLPKRVGRVMAAGPGPANSAAIGPRLCRMVRVKNVANTKEFFRTMMTNYGVDCNMNIATSSVN